MQNRKIHIGDQLKTSRGQFPVSSASVELAASGRREVVYRFSEASPTHMAFSLEDLAGCLRSSRQLEADEICGRIEQFACKSGPLFGEAKSETVADWQLAIYVAQEAMRLQQQVNGTRPWVPENESVTKTRVEDEEGNLLFTYYCFAFAIGGEGAQDYSESIPKKMWVRTFSDANSNDYLYAKYQKDENSELFEVYAIVCPSTISPEILVQTLCFLNESALTEGELSAIGADRLAGRDADELARSARAYNRDNAVRYYDQPIGKKDAPHVQHIIQAMAAIHLQRVTIDLFKSDDTDDLLSFDTFLSSLWHRFALQLGSVKVGYCQECGAGFSLTGHRGLPKMYCSNKCRTKAKNRREQEKRDKVRSLYLKGKSIDDIIHELYPGKSARATRRDVIGILSTWPQLKHARDAEWEQPGDHPLTHRCLEDGIIDDHQMKLYENKLERREARQR